MTSSMPAGPPGERTSRAPGYHVEILLISFAALLLEISYTRIVSFKLFYYYTYLVIGLALLGLGTGGVLMAVSGRLRRATTEAILRWGLVLGALSVGVGYAIVAWVPMRSMAVWDYGTGSSIANFAKLVLLCLALFASFIAVGVMIAALFGRRSDQIGRLYFADLLGAGLACAIVVPLISSSGPPAIVCLAGVVLALTGASSSTAQSFTVGAARCDAGRVCSCLGVLAPDLLPDIRVDDDKADPSEAETSKWSPVFRVDVVPFFDRQLLNHDGLPGSVILHWDGDLTSLTDLEFDRDPRSLPFDTLGEPPESVMIIGAAGGHEVLASLAYDADQIDAIELNPATHELVTEKYADFSGRFFDQPGVSYVNADGRAYLARSDDSYDLIWYPAPDSYAASNVAASGAFVLSESYLYTSETITETLEHLSTDGILAAQFGELRYDDRANRTLRYAGTVRHALVDQGIEDPGSHVLVASTADPSNASLRYSTVLVKQTPFTAAEVERFTGFATSKPDTRVEHVPGQTLGNSVSEVLTLPDGELDDWYSSYEYDVTPIEDDGPFFWHFARFRDVIGDIGDPIDQSVVDPEDAVGERVLLLLLVIATLLGAVFLLLPFVAVREVWSVLPRKRTSALYFAALGLGFMFFEITLIQKLVLFLGYPTYSLTVTLASILIFTGVGALLSERFASRVRAATRLLLPAIAALTAFYLFALPEITDALLAWPLAARVVVAFVVLAPLGVCLGMFMPLGIRNGGGPVGLSARVRRLGLGRERLRLGRRRGAHHHDRHDVRLQRRARDRTGRVPRCAGSPALPGCRVTAGRRLDRSARADRAGRRHVHRQLLRFGAQARYPNPHAPNVGPPLRFGAPGSAIRTLMPPSQSGSPRGESNP